MRYLLDTHCFLWHFREPGRLSAGARAVLSDPNAALWLSTASIWEMVIKERSGKLTLPEPVSDFVDTRVTALGCAVLAIEQPHLRVLASLDMHHRDPFDRMLVAQAKHEDMTLVTGDDVLRAYGVPILWAK